MKKVLIIGATGSLAQSVIETLKSLDDIKLTLFSRSVNSLPKKLIEGCETVQGDAMKLDHVKKAIAGKDVVYINLAGDLETMVGNIVQAMQETGVKRVIAISSIGIYDTPLKSVLKPYRKLADTIEASDLAYTILRPDWFTNANEVDYTLTRKGEPETGTAISRKSIASFIATIISHPEKWENENIGISKPG